MCTAAARSATVRSIRRSAPTAHPWTARRSCSTGTRSPQGHDFFSLGTFDVSPDGRWLAYSTDYSGDERFTLRVKDLTTGEVLADEVPDTSYGTAWSGDASALFYVTVDDAWRPNKVWRHTVGTPAGEDVLVYEESDERFFVGVELTRSERFVLIESHSKVTSEVWVIPADNPTGEPAVVAPRRQGVEYSVEHHGHRFLILHNDGAEDFELAYTSADAPGDWTPLIPHTPGVRLEGVDAFANYLVVSLRSEGLTGLRVLAIGSTDGYDIDFPDPIYSVGLDSNPEYQTTRIRLRYTSLITPSSLYDFDLTTREMVLRKQQPVLPGPDGRPFDPAGYEQHREWAVADDGTKVPISLVCRAGTPRDGSAPAVIYGYGSYEASMDPWFSIARLSLLDRGVVFAVAHIRGGGELGRHWYEQGKMLAKKNTFTDFVACARHLASSGWTSPDRLVARGGSAGGLLMGAVANLAPDAFAGIVAQVPFVDALNSILDPSLPLTVTEWEEWGNPLDRPGGLRVHEVLHPVRERGGRRLPGDPGGDRPQRHPRALPRAGQVDRPAARHRPRRRRTCSRPRWARVTAAPAAVTTPGRKRRSSTPGPWTSLEPRLTPPCPVPCTAQAAVCPTGRAAAWRCVV